MSNDLQADLTADLLSDLGRAAELPADAPLPSAPAPATTPAVSLTLTPLRWSPLSLDTPERGTGLAVRLGPWRVEVAL